MTVSPSNLKVGHIYFACGYSHPRLPVLDIETYVYLGKNLFPEDHGKDFHYFQSPHKYFEAEIQAAKAEIHAAISEKQSEQQVKSEGLPDRDCSDNSEMILIDEADLECTIYDLDGLIEFVSKERGGSIF